ncbi:hypothetical protein ML401_20660 [Bradyrhizobium sp. 62B]|uniref:hypothetical protein n=1 Tax=Bradyrhizobium sp. 62B TaxID=2898442 RepID=UPI0025581EB0|nr:hypothetical protein ML401_20660 [Bradyrhizobium sp. 62B]
MKRRDFLTTLATSAILGTTTTAAFSQHNDPLRSGSGLARRQTGRVDLILEGHRAGLKNGNDILQVAKSTQFYQEGRVKVTLGRGEIEYVPAVFPTNAIGMALIDGIMTHKFTIAGSPPPQWGFLSSGTFYNHLDFVEGPDFDEGRWLARIVDETGKVRRLTTGAIVRQIIDLHVDEKLAEQHRKPSFHIHALASGAEEQQLAAGSEGEEPILRAWSVTNGDWVPAGNGCARVQTCTPPA